MLQPVSTVRHVLTEHQPAHNPARGSLGEGDCLRQGAMGAHQRDKHGGLGGLRGLVDDDAPEAQPAQPPLIAGARARRAHHLAGARASGIISCAAVPLMR